MQQPRWLAVLKLAGIDEMIYLDNPGMWQDQAEAQGLRTEDVLVDVDGTRFGIVQQQPRPLDALSLDTFDAWVRAHLVAMQQCCVYKLALSSYRQGIELVRDSQEEGLDG